MKSITKITTPRLLIRCYKISDAQPLKEAIDSSLNELLPWMPWAKLEPVSIEEKEKLLSNFIDKYEKDEDYTMGIFDKKTEMLLGSTGLHKRSEEGILEIGYWIKTSESGKGIITESTYALTRAAFDFYRVHKVEIKCKKDNIKSAAVPQRLGFTLEVLAPSVRGCDQQWFILKEDFKVFNEYEKVEFV